MSTTATKPNTKIAQADPATPANPTVVVGKLIANYTSKGSLYLPEDYSPENALKSAWLALQTFDLEQFDRGSLINSLLDMVVQGLNPQKKQCYFIPYGKSMTCQRSYFGDQALAVRVKPGIEIVAQVVYEGDTFEYSMMRGRKTVAAHSQKLANVNMSKIVAAYCEVYDANGESLGAEIMTWEQIQKSWAKSKTYKPGGNGPHNEQPDQMALRTVIRRRCKPIINSANDELLMAAVRREEIAQGEAEIAEEVELYANQSPLSLPEQAVAVHVVEGVAEPTKAEAPSQPTPSAASGENEW